MPLDWQLTDTYFVVAHLHYVLIGINVFPVIGGIYFWFPKMTGRLIDERLGRWNFWTMFIGFNLGFFPMHMAGLMGMPRRIYTYAAHMGWNGLNLIISTGSSCSPSACCFAVQCGHSLRRGGRRANPWDAPTLEWSVPSPPPAYNFAVIPIIASRHPLWEERLRSPRALLLTRGYLLDDGKETIATTALDAHPDMILDMPVRSSSTIADSIAVDAPRNGIFALAKLRRHGGAAVVVTDEEILEAQLLASSRAGLFAEPSSACALAGFMKARFSLGRGENAVVMMTGSGLKDIKTAAKAVGRDI